MHFIRLNILHTIVNQHTNMNWIYIKGALHPIQRGLYSLQCHRAVYPLGGGESREWLIKFHMVLYSPMGLWDPPRLTRLDFEQLFECAAHSKKIWSKRATLVTVLNLSCCVFQTKCVSVQRNGPRIQRFQFCNVDKSFDDTVVCMLKLFFYKSHSCFKLEC